MVHQWQTLRNYSAYRTHLPELSRTRIELIIFIQCLRTSTGCRYCIDYKVASLVYKVRSPGNPAYLQLSVSDYTPTRQLRSLTQLFVLKPPVRTEFARRAFSQAATAPNGLPLASRSADAYERSDLQLRNIFTNWLLHTDRSDDVFFILTTYGVLPNA